MKKKNKKTLNQFVIVPTIGVSWGCRGVYLHFAWLHLRFSRMISNTIHEEPLNRNKKRTKMIRHTCKLFLNQFVIIPAIGFTRRNGQLHFFITWLRSRIGFIIDKDVDRCEDCPCYIGGTDYFGDGYEYCSLSLSCFDSCEEYQTICLMPVFIRKIYGKYHLWKEDRYWRKQSKIDYESELKQPDPFLTDLDENDS